MMDPEMNLPVETPTAGILTPARALIAEAVRRCGVLGIECTVVEKRKLFDDRLLALAIERLQSIAA
jgi:hypothetical protein